MNGSLLFEPSNSGAFLGGGIFYGYLDGITLVKTCWQGDGEGRAEDCMDRAEVMLPGSNDELPKHNNNHNERMRRNRPTFTCSPPTVTRSITSCEESNLNKCEREQKCNK